MGTPRECGRAESVRHACFAHSAPPVTTSHDTRATRRRVDDSFPGPSLLLCPSDGAQAMSFVETFETMDRKIVNPCEQYSVESQGLKAQPCARVITQD